MKTFIVLIPVDITVIETRPSCELIENMVFSSENEKPLAHNVLKKVLTLLSLENNIESKIEVETIGDFMDRVNDQEFNADDYFISYVYM